MFISRGITQIALQRLGWQKLRQLLSDRSGAAAVTLAFSLTAIVGMAGLGSEAASWYFTHRAMQGAADAAAITGAATLAAGATSTLAQTDAKSVAANFNFIDGTANTNVTVNSPPASGSHAGDSNYIEVLITQTQQRQLTSLFMSTNPNIQARSIAFANRNVSDQGCVLALTTDTTTGINVSGSTNMSFSGCALYDNAAGGTALNLNGSATVSAAAAYVHGSISGSGLTTTDGAYTGTNPIADPYASVNVPSYSNPSCKTQNKVHVNAGNTASYDASNATDNICVFNNDVQVDGGATLIFCPGVYIFKTGSLIIQGNGTLLAPPATNPSPPNACHSMTGGVTIIFTNDPGGNPGIANIASNATIRLIAPTTGTTAGLALFQDRLPCNGNGNNNNGCNNSVSGGTTNGITGAIYFPNAAVNYTGGSAAGGSLCTQLIANTITLSGSPTFQSGCSSAGTKVVNRTGAQLVQ